MYLAKRMLFAFVGTLALLAFMDWLGAQEVDPVPTAELMRYYPELTRVTF